MTIWRTWTRISRAGALFDRRMNFHCDGVDGDECYSRLRPGVCKHLTAMRLDHKELGVKIRDSTSKRAQSLISRITKCSVAG